VDGAAYRYGRQFSPKVATLRCRLAREIAAPLLVLQLEISDLASVVGE
jgi:hypothetical protein